MTERPLIPGTLRGYREWKYDEVGQLRPITFHSKIWRGGEQTAKCGVPPCPNPESCLEPAWHHSPVPAPVQECTCGVYAYLAPNPLRRRPGVVFGAIEAWGKVVIHETGFRAQHARVIALSAEIYEGQESSPFAAILHANPGIAVCSTDEQLIKQYPAQRVEI